MKKVNNEQLKEVIFDMLSDNSITFRQLALSFFSSRVHNKLSFLNTLELLKKDVEQFMVVDSKDLHDDLFETQKSPASTTKQGEQVTICTECAMTTIDDKLNKASSMSLKTRLRVLSYMIKTGAMLNDISKGADVSMQDLTDVVNLKVNETIDNKVNDYLNEVNG